MPWRAKGVEKERLRFIVGYETGLFKKGELCARHAISRPTGDALLKRWSEEGVAGLKDRSRAPKHSPQRISKEIEAVLVQMRQDHPDWGPRKILSRLEEDQPGLGLPAASTVGDLFVRAGLVEPRKRQRRWRHPGRTTLSAVTPNEVWTADFKGEFRTGNGKKCYPLTVADAHTRFLLACEGLSSIAHQGALEVFVSLFQEYGLPRAIRSDNGGPFATKAMAGLSRLSVWWTELGIVHDRIEPGHPEQNGSHERMHRTLKRATLRPPAADGAEQQMRFDAFRSEFNARRPHEALAMKTPGSLYAPSTRPMPSRVAPPAYAGHCIVRRVRGNGILYFRDHQFFLSELLIGKDVALEEISDGVWSIYFYDLLLARLDERTWKIAG